MQQNATLRLFKRGPTAEFRLLVILVLSLVLLVVDARWKVFEPARQAVSVLIYPFQRAAMAPRDLIEGVRSWTNAATVAKEEKEALQRQRIELAQLASHAAQLATENQQLRRLLNVTAPAEQQSVAVEVLYEPANPYTRHLIFNKGSDSGIASGMPVIDEGGVVGQVVRVTPFTSEAALITDEKVSVPVQVVRNGLRLIAFGGNPAGKIEARFLPLNADVRAGDTLVTSGIGGLFPAGLAVARVDEVRRDVVSGFAVAVATPLSHPERYRHFLVLLSEQSELLSEVEP
ncbi:MAG TPA: rod shape-determining protein MreC [Pusillimonas sp.]|jgi:rod shape-determining protein MreC|nr:rod shape-determining protein MreC [Pusillimonas sp.]MBC41681.1 rod shape-determining protein MreC [Pusillimonas sp.]HBT33319.1 rod shape-determining protein MreC [Pusillimonas sp.]HCP79572.1 rod shape-determining protein MreC [Pusillimonas sp.]|tara:strand:- start:70227 stop:71090 length:864 start_codon:yes stop_codon:yes gene_type:complete